MKIIYAGNRSFALSSLEIKLKNELCIFAIKNSFLEKYAKSNEYEFYKFSSEKSLYELLDKIKERTLFISCGVPFKIDIERFPLIAFINIHPSLLPDLKGRDPAIGLLIEGGDLGITIHQMTMNIDSGYILWQSKPIKIDKEMDIKDIYSLSFILEKKAGKELASQIISNGLDQFINKFLTNILFNKNKHNKKGTYFNRTKNYGFYKEIYTNDELIKHVKSASLYNYGTKARIVGDFYESEIIINNCYLIKNNVDKFLEIFELNTQIQSRENILLYVLEDRISVLRNNQIILMNVRNKIRLQYQFDKDKIIYFKECLI